MIHTSPTGIYMLHVLNGVTFGDKVVFRFITPVNRFLGTLGIRSRDAALEGWYR